MEKIDYQCPACHGISKVPKNCGTKGCKLEGTPLKKHVHKE
jgi:hypothetical protein